MQGGQDLVLSSVYYPTVKVDEDIYRERYNCKSIIKFRPEPGMNYQLTFGGGPIILTRDELKGSKKQISLSNDGKSFLSWGKTEFTIMLVGEKAKTKCNPIELVSVSADGQRSPVPFERKRWAESLSKRGLLRCE